MCKDCGCDAHGSGHVHYHNGVPHSHHHGDGSHHHHDHDPRPAKTITLEKRILEKNDEAAELNRKWLAQRGIVCVNIISSPGSGKTALLEKTLDMLSGKVGCAVITGDLQTDNDAARLRGRGATVAQIETGSSCHLTAEQIGRTIPEVVTPDTKLLFIENVGNLVCPAAFDLGENFKIALLSVTEGEDKPVKYPTLFSSAKLAVVTKTDLLRHLDCDMPKLRGSVRKVNPGVFIFELSSKTSDGMDKWIEYLTGLVS